MICKCLDCSRPSELKRSIASLAKNPYICASCARTRVWALKRFPDIFSILQFLTECVNNLESKRFTHLQIIEIEHLKRRIEILNEDLMVKYLEFKNGIKAKHEKAS